MTGIKRRAASIVALVGVGSMTMMTTGCNPGETAGATPRASAPDVAAMLAAGCDVEYDEANVHTFSISGDVPTEPFAIEDIAFDVSSGGDGLSIIATNAAGESVSRLDAGADVADMAMTVPGLTHRVLIRCGPDR